jgi:hypothetical protein
VDAGGHGSRVPGHIHVAEEDNDLAGGVPVALRLARFGWSDLRLAGREVRSAGEANPRDLGAVGTSPAVELHLLLGRAKLSARTDRLECCLHVPRPAD